MNEKSIGKFLLPFASVAVLAVFLVACSVDATGSAARAPASVPADDFADAPPGLATAAEMVPTGELGGSLAGHLPTPTPTPEPEEAPVAPKTDIVSSGAEESDSISFAVGNELTIAALRDRVIDGSAIAIEEALADGANYTQSIASYMSEGNKIYGLLTVPKGKAPEGGFPAIVFNHGYIPPSVYRTTERYEAYVDALARNGFVVFKIDLRGFGNSEGEPTGAYFSPGYTIDAISALKSLQTLDYVNPNRIGMWGHSMAGNLVLRAMLAEPDVRAGVIWAGAVFSYDDMVRYAIDDPSFRRDEQPLTMSAGRLLRDTYGPPDTGVPFWQAVSLTENIEFLESPLQLHHALNDTVVDVGYSQDLARVLQETDKVYEFYQYDGGGHNISGPAFAEAMRRTVAFFRSHL